MKSLANIITFCSVLVLMTANTIQLSAQNNTLKPLEGIWVGKLEIPNNAILRMGIIVNKDGSAALNIIDQATGNIPIDEVSYDGDTVSFKLNRLGITIKGNISTDKDSIWSTFSQRGGEFTLNLGLVDELPQLKRPQTPKEPFGYASEEIEFENKEADVKLQGTLTLPELNAKVPAVVLLTGSGQQGRDQDIGGHKHFWVIADYLTRNGIAVIRMDDRGFGGSTGDFNTSTTDDFAKDALAAVDYLKYRKEIDVNQIGLIGHSEGGAKAVIAASQSNDVKFIVSLSGGIVNFGDIHIHQITDRLRSQNIPEENIKLETEWRRKLNEIVREPTDSVIAAEKMWAAYNALTEEDIKAMNWPEGRMNHMVSQLLSPWWRYSISLDIISLYMGLDCPALLLFGEKDVQATAKDNMPLIEAAVEANEKTNISIRLIDGVNHLYQTAETGSEYEYIQIEETISPTVLELISDWILKR
ncbi:MAG: alpha/beta hydrolase [Cyclobacteriaceae bacterium]|nr:alpha/beta hydrolase [Cyclobacteriaceae bacterium]